ncbi:hypothetical protein IFM89_008543 [Coptis chinensis]|uniref:Protein kinase domain-containing protein n=1 Tax=Coptis chinensis TaxID=261450 RepID=A0A835LU46_9MAGN|nr:hypothetical protein IFM89_008543 [Coptis chinensis]
MVNAVKESEHLDWEVRLRIAMGIAYCLEHIHQMNPPIVHKKLHSSTIYLAEDYAAKISDFGFWNEATMAKMRKRPFKDMVDPTLKSFQEDDIEKLCLVITSCIHSDPNQRPKMSEVTARLREITSMAPDRATPRLSLLWWAELEILSIKAS